MNLLIALALALAPLRAHAETLAGGPEARARTHACPPGARRILVYPNATEAGASVARAGRGAWIEDVAAFSDSFGRPPAATVNASGYCSHLPCVIRTHDAHVTELVLRCRPAYEQRGLAPVSTKAATASTKAATARGLEVCVVGNGPLSSKDREFIKSTNCDEVWRFNDMKNMRKGERCDGHFVRYHGNKGGGYFGITNPPKIAVPKAVKRIYMGGPKHDNATSLTRIFSICNDKVSHTNWLHTSGAVALSYFEGRDDVDSITVFGMNFMLVRGSKHEKGEKKIIDACCTKCRIRKPPRNTYHKRSRG